MVRLKSVDIPMQGTIEFVQLPIRMHPDQSTIADRFCQNSEDNLVERPLMEYACEKQTSDEE